MKFKKLLAGLLAGAMVLGCVPQTVWGENAGQVQAEGTTTDSTVAGTVTAGGVVPGYTADAANDDLTESYWYAAGDLDTFWYDMEFKNATLVDGIRVLPRTAGSAGVITEYEVWVKASTGTSEDWEDDYIKVCSGTWNDNGDGQSIWKTAKFEPVETTNVRIVAVETSGGSCTEDTEYRRNALETLIMWCEGIQKDLYTATTWTSFTTALDNAKTQVENGTYEGLASAYTALSEARSGLTVRTNYTAADPFQFPTEVGQGITLEAEFATSITNSDDKDSDPNYDICVSPGDWASNGKFLNCMAYYDWAYYAYNAEKTGYYRVIGWYRSGDTNNGNKLAWSTEGHAIQQGDVTCPYTGSQTKTFECIMQVNNVGAGTLRFTAKDTGKAPQLDKLYLIYVGESAESTGHTITTTTGSHGKITADGMINGNVSVSNNGSATFTITPDAGYAVRDVKVDGTSVGAVTTYQLSNVTSAHTIQAYFDQKYTESNPFVFPAAQNATVTLETEHATSVEGGTIANGDGWASNGKFLNSFGANDWAKYAYYAPVAGTYQVKAYYRSGALGQGQYPWNTMQWSGNNITSGNVEFGNTNVSGQGLTVQTVTFDMNVTQAGAGTLVLQATSGREMPQLDKLEIKLADGANNANKTVSMVEFQVTATTEKSSYFKGGSLRMDNTDSTYSNMRYQYEFPTTLNGMNLVDNQWSWAYCTLNEDNTVAETGMSTVKEGKFVKQDGICYSNLVFTNIAVANYNRDIYAQLVIPYSNTDGETLTVYTSLENRSVSGVATKVAQYGSTAEQRAYATNLLNAMNESKVQE